MYHMYTQVRVAATETIVARGIPSTRALLFLKEQGVAFDVHQYEYRGTGHVAQTAAAAIGAPPEAVIKTVVFMVDGDPVLALMDAAGRVSVSRLAAALGSKSRAAECQPDDAERFTGYQVGGISPFGTRRRMPVVLDELLTLLPRVFINGGSRGLIVSLDTEDLIKVLDAVVANIRTD